MLVCAPDAARRVLTLVPRRGAERGFSARAFFARGACPRRRRRCAAVLLLTLLAPGMLFTGYAAEDSEGNAAPGMPVAVSQEPLSNAVLPEVEASAYIVMDADSGQVLLQKDPDARHFPASVTKIMTAGLVLEACGGRLSAPVTASEAALAAVGEGSTMISLRPGETLTVEQLLYATMLQSANDAANVLGEYVDGELAAFVRRMNEAARSLDMTHTHFENPSGYHADAHYTTARDLAKAMRWALTVPGFPELLRLEEYTLPPTNETAYPRRFQTDNRLLLDGEQHYDGILGGKSGWTPEARYTMIEAARRNGHTLIVVVLDCPTAAHRYADCAALLDYCFTNFRSYELNGAALALPEIQVWSGGEQKGMAQLETAAASLLLPEGCMPEDLRIETEIPRWYIYGVEFEAAASVVDTRTGREICSVALEPEPEALQRLLGRSLSNDHPWDSRKLPGLALGAAMLAVLAVFTTYYARRAERMRRNAARSSIRRLRSALPVREKAKEPEEGNGPDTPDGPEEGNGPDAPDTHGGRSGSPGAGAHPVPEKLPVRRRAARR